MANLLQTGAAWLAEQRREQLSSPLIYERPGLGAVALAAMRGRSEAELERRDGSTTIERSIDWLLSPEDLVIGGIARRPELGDTLTETLPTGTIKYEVTTLGPEPCWRWSDSYRRTMRVHTKVVSG